MMVTLLDKNSIERILVTWCHVSGCEWGQAFLLDRTGWDARRRACRVRGCEFPAADWVLSLTGSWLYEVMNHNGLHLQRGDLLDYLCQHRLGLKLFSANYAEIIPIEDMPPR